MEIRLPFTSFLCFVRSFDVVTRIQSSAARQSENLGKWYTTGTVITERKFPTKISGIFLSGGTPLIFMNDKHPLKHETNKTDRNPAITNQNLGPFELVQVNMCFPSGPLR